MDNTIKVIIVAALLSGCASTEEQAASQPDIQLNLPATTAVKTKNIELTDNSPLADIELPEQQVPDKLVRASVPKLTAEKVTGGFEQSDSQLVNKHICKWSDATYRVADANGYMNSFKTKVQLQAKILSVSPNEEVVKFSITGWYSEDQTFKAWVPRLRQPASAGGFILQQGKEYSDQLANWQVCRLSS
ncbi:hypothetical protein ACMZOO_07935 [Catenovulum sp. SX2]|uniref:hypothetical protein n=1 Tax=Catenovulum sp. SX2 TaxID=3398614 RepID=UPI003F859CD6